MFLIFGNGERWRKGEEANGPYVNTLREAVATTA